MLEYAQTATAHRHQVEPLHHNQVDKVDGRRLRELLVVVVIGDIGWYLAEGEPQVLELDALALQVPVGHGKRSQRLGHADDAVGLEDELPVDQAVLLDVSRAAVQHVCLGLFVGQDSGGDAVGKAAALVSTYTLRGLLVRHTR